MRNWERKKGNKIEENALLMHLRKEEEREKEAHLCKKKKLSRHIYEKQIIDSLIIRSQNQITMPVWTNLCNLPVIPTHYSTLMATEHGNAYRAHVNNILLLHHSNDKAEN